MSTPPQTATVSVVDILPETSDTQTFRLSGPLNYKAGQAVGLVIPGDPKKRYYSLSSSPTEKGYLSVTIKVRRSNPSAVWQFVYLKKGIARRNFWPDGIVHAA